MSVQIRKSLIRLLGAGVSKPAGAMGRRRKREPLFESLEGRQVLSAFSARHAFLHAHPQAEVARVKPLASSRASQAFKAIRPILGTWQTQTFFSAFGSAMIPNVPNTISTTDTYVRFGNSVLKTVDGTRQGFAGDNLKIVPMGGAKLQLQFYHPGNSTIPVAILNGVRTGFASWVFTGSAPLDANNPATTASVRLTYSFITREQRSFTNEIFVGDQYKLLYTSISNRVS